MKYRHEYKCYVNPVDLAELRSRIRRVMQHDKYALDDGNYTVKSMYFDNYLDKALREKQDGVDEREKYRIRYYNDDISFIRLEKKSKKNGMCRKQSSKISIDFCENIIASKPFNILDYESDIIKEFNIKRRTQLLRPKNIVIYEREAFVYEPGNVRVTFDTNIRGSYNINHFLKPDITAIHLLQAGILEIKWDEFLPQFIRDIIQLKNRHITSFSKYAATRFI